MRTLVLFAVPQSGGSLAWGINPRLNLVFIFAYHLRRRVLRCVRDALARTPHLDQIAREGVTYENHSVITSICAFPAADPGQTDDLAAKHPQLVAELSAAYERHWADIYPARRAEARPTRLSADWTEEIVLTPATWRPDDATSGKLFLTNRVRTGQGGPGHWLVKTDQAADGLVVLRRWPVEVDSPISSATRAHRGELVSYPEGRALPITRASLVVDGQEFTSPVAAGATEVHFRVGFRPGVSRLEARFENSDLRQSWPAYYVYLRRPDQSPP